MKHFILTRYNCGWDPDRPIDVKRVTEGSTVGPLDWLNRRRELFLDYCLPSVKAQSVKDFAWVLGVSPQTPAGYFDFLADVTDLDIELHAGYFDGDFKRSLFDRCGPGPLLTTRLDNDDAIAPAFVERVQATALEYANHESVLIDVWGHRYLANRKLFIVENYGMKHASHYCSVLSSPDRYQWVYEADHGSMPGLADHMVKIRESLYVTVLHEQNLGNHAFRGGDANMDWFLPYCP